MANYGGGAPISGPRKSNVISSSGVSKATVHGSLAPRHPKRPKAPKQRMPKRPRNVPKPKQGKVRKPGRPVDPYASQVNAAANAKYGQAFHQLNAQTAQNQVMGGRIGSWYDEYVNQVNQARQQAGAGYQSAAAGLSADQQNLRAGDQNAANSLLAAEQKNAQLTGAKFDPSAAAQFLQASGSRAQGSNAYLGNYLGHAAADNTYLADQGRIGGLAKAQALSDNAAAGRGLARDRLNLIKDQGDFKVSTRASLVDAAHKSALEDAAFGLNTFKAKSTAAYQQQKIKADQAKARTARMQSDRKYKLDLAKFGAAKAKQRWTERNAAANRAAANARANARANRSRTRKGQLTQTGVNKILDGISTTRQVYGGLRHTGLSPAAARSAILNGYYYANVGGKAKRFTVPKAPALYVNVAMDLNIHGYVTNGNVRALKQRGIRAGKHFPTRANAKKLPKGQGKKVKQTFGGVF